MTDTLQLIARRVADRSGNVLGPARQPALRAAIDRLYPGTAPAEMLELIDHGRRGVAALDRLVEEITISETFFMRHRSELDAIPWANLLVNARRGGRSVVRVWCAACATGEEAYSLVMLALEALPGETTPVSVLATDISPSCLHRTAEGRYGRRAIRLVEPALRRRYFDSGENQLTQVRGEVRRHVRVASHNLVTDPVPPAGERRFDLIVCRNVLIYFDLETAARTAVRLRAALVTGGVMVLGASDRLTLPRPVRSTGSRPAPPLVDAPDPLAQALADADAGCFAAALTRIQPVLDADPLNPVALFLHGLVLHAQGDPAAALDPLRRAVYLDPSFGRAAFELGRAQDALGNRPAAHRAYRQALEELGDREPEHLVLGPINDGLRDACRLALAASAGDGNR
jgi:chemotaxis protein methyltransferase CheR